MGRGGVVILNGSGGASAANMTLFFDVGGAGSPNVACAVIKIALTEHPRGEFGRPEDKRGGRALVL